MPKHAQLDRVAQAIIRTALGPHQRQVLGAKNVVLGHFSGFGRDAEQARPLFGREKGSALHSGSGVMAEGRS